MKLKSADTMELVRTTSIDRVESFLHTASCSQQSSIPADPDTPESHEHLPRLSAVRQTPRTLCFPHVFDEVFQDNAV